MSLDDLYNHLKVYESEVQKKTEPNSQNMAFISSAKHSIGNEDGNTASVPTASTNVPTASASDINQIDEDDMEEMDIKWNMELLSMRANKFWKRTGKKISIQGSDMAGFDKSKVECFNCHKMGHFAREYRAPRSQDRGRRDNFRQGSKAEEQALKALMAIDGVGWDWSYMENDREDHALVANEEAPTEFALMANTSTESKRADKSKEGLGYSDVPPPPAQLYSSPKKDLNFPTANRKFPTASRNFPTGSTKFSTAHMGMKGKAVKPSACWIWKPSQNLSNKGPNNNSVSVMFKKYTYIDTQGRLNGCSRHMTGNISYFFDYEPFDGGYVSFGQGGCKITRKGTIKTDKLKFENVYFVKDLKEFSNARTPQQNGVAERRNRTLIEAARTMLADAKLPVTFWAEAVNTACYVQNRVKRVENKAKTEDATWRRLAANHLCTRYCAGGGWTNRKMTRHHGTVAAEKSVRGTGSVRGSEGLEKGSTSALDSKLLLINSNSQHLEKKEQEVKNVVEQPAEHGNRSIQSLQNFRVVHKSSISFKDTSQISLIHSVAPIQSTKEPEHSLSMGYEHPSITLETESDEVIESNAENLLSIASKCEVTLEDEIECDMPAKDDCSPVFTTFSNPLFKDNDDLDSNDDESLPDEDVPAEEFKIYSNPLFDEDEINSDKLDPHCFNVESDFVESLLNHDTFIDFSSKFDFSGELAHIKPEIPKSDFDFEEEIRLTENLLYDNSFPRPPDGNSQREEIDIVTETDDVLPSSDDNDDDYDLLLREADLFLSDDSIPSGIEIVADDPEGDVLMEDIDEPDEHFNPGGEIFVSTKIEDDDYFHFMFIIRIFLPYLILPEISPLLLSAESEDTIFDPGLFSGD
nr:ribonuclease H-like domain-containing protein [Tanacetum cinerariifolium]